MQCNLGVNILDLDSCAPKSIHELSERLIIYLSQTGQGGRGHGVRLVGGVLRTKSFNEGVEAIYGFGWESIVLGQCCPLEGRREDTTKNHVVTGVEVCLCQEGMQMLA